MSALERACRTWMCGLLGVTIGELIHSICGTFVVLRQALGRQQRLW